jgi:hypothetical protein
MSDPIRSGAGPFDWDKDEHRWCVYCGADCWLEPARQQHAPDCSFVTGLYTLTEDDTNPHTDFGSCTLCAQPFLPGDTYMLVDDTTGRTYDPTSDTAWIVCVGCAATGGDPRPSHSAHGPRG